MACLQNKRGKKVPGNKIEIIKEHIQQFPKYCSHYSREKNPSRKYLPQGLNIRQMYKLYETFCEEKEVVPEK